MKGIPTRLWTCDKCGTTATVGVNLAPAGWRHVSAAVCSEIRTVRDEQFDADWCGTCVAVYLPPLDREADR